MHAAIEAKDTANKARVVAGYCWPWRSKTNASAIDIEISVTYRRRWNLDTDGSLNHVYCVDSGLADRLRSRLVDAPSAAEAG